MDNMKTMTIQMPEETYQRMKDYLKRHQVKQKDFVTRLMEAALEKEPDPAREAYKKHTMSKQNSCFLRRIRV